MFVKSGYEKRYCYSLSDRKQHAAVPNVARKPYGKKWQKDMMKSECSIVSTKAGISTA